MILTSNASAAGATASQIVGCDKVWEKQLPVAVKASDIPAGAASGILFLDDDHLLTYHIERTGDLSVRGAAAQQSAFRLRAFAIDVSSGEITATKEWNTTLHDSTVQATSGGFVIRTGDTARFYSKDLNEVDHRDLPRPTPRDQWVISTSSSGNTVLLNHYSSSGSDFELRDGRSFRLTGAWRDPNALRHSYSISDLGIAKTPITEDSILYAKFGSWDWQRLPGNVKPACVGTPFLIGESLVATAGCANISITTLEGELLMTDRGLNGSLPGQEFAAARDGTVMAKAIGEGKGGGFFDTDIHMTGIRVVVYSLRLKKRIADVALRPEPKKTFGFAISPDGSKLAILHDGSVSVCAVEH